MRNLVHEILDARHLDVGGKVLERSVRDLTAESGMRNEALEHQEDKERSRRRVEPRSVTTKRSRLSYLAVSLLFSLLHWTQNALIDS